MSENGNGTYKTAHLPICGRDIQIDMEAMHNSLRKVRDVRNIARLQPLSDDHLAWVAARTGLTVDEILDLDTDDFTVIDSALGAAMRDLSGPNSS